jgi:hypothetical protein
MDQRHGPETDRVARARALVAAAAKGVARLESAANQAFCRLAALAGMLNRLEKLTGSRVPEAAEAAALDVATVCREAKVLLRYTRSRRWRPAQVDADGPYPSRPPARPGGATSGWR